MGAAKFPSCDDDFCAFNEVKPIYKVAGKINLTTKWINTKRYRFIVKRSIRNAKDEENYQEKFKIWKMFKISESLKKKLKKNILITIGILISLELQYLNYYIAYKIKQKDLAKKYRLNSNPDSLKRSIILCQEQMLFLRLPRIDHIIDLKT